MKLPPELEFYEDIHLLIYRPQGVIDEAAVKKVVSLLEDLEAKLAGWLGVPLGRLEMRRDSL